MVMVPALGRAFSPSERRSRMKLRLDLQELESNRPYQDPAWQSGLHHLRIRLSNNFEMNGKKTTPRGDDFDQEPGMVVVTVPIGGTDPNTPCTTGHGRYDKRRGKNASCSGVIIRRLYVIVTLWHITIQADKRQREIEHLDIRREHTGCLMADSRNKTWPSAIASE